MKLECSLLGAPGFGEGVSSADEASAGVTAAACSPEDSRATRIPLRRGGRVQCAADAENSVGGNGWRRIGRIVSASSGGLLLSGTSFNGCTCGNAWSCEARRFDKIALDIEEVETEFRTHETAGLLKQSYAGAGLLEVNLLQRLHEFWRRLKSFGALLGKQLEDNAL